VKNIPDKINHYEKLLKVLLKLYPEREAHNIAKIYFQDRFGISNKSVNLSSVDSAILNLDIQRFKNNEPIQYIVEKTFFFDSFFKINKSVLIPRPETETLVQSAINSIKKYAPTILDIGTGSGCIALSIAAKYTDAQITAIDISSEALSIARINKEAFNIKNVNFKKIDFLDKTSHDDLITYDIIVSNPPYIKQDEKQLMSTSTLKYEPDIALFPPGEDYLVFYKSIFEFAKSHLNKKGVVLCEINEFSKKDLAKLLFHYNYKWEIINDFQGKPRVLKLEK